MSSANAPVWEGVTRRWDAWLVMAARLSPRRFIAVVSAILAVYSFARVAVLFFEALAVVKEGRSEDYELLELCQRGDARGSSKMREACLKARADVASWIVLKAIVQAVSVAFKDFSDTVGSPFKFSVVALFIVSSVALPVLPWCRALFGQGATDYQPMNGVHYISYASPPHQHGRLRRKVGRALGRLKLRPSPSIEEVGTDEGDIECMETEEEEASGFKSTKQASRAWHAIDLGLGWGERPVSPSQHTKWD